jgi:cytosine/adenosine deaminase-related metal-dependent hydrolase
MPQSLTFTARDALRWVTLNGAEACGMESTIGSLRPGKEADIVVIGGSESVGFRPRIDPAGSVVFQTGTHDVRDVLIAGKLMKENGKLVGVDLRGTLDRAESSAAAILERVHKSTPRLPPRSARPFEAMEERLRRNLAGAHQPGQASNR